MFQFFLRSFSLSIFDIVLFVYLFVCHPTTNPATQKFLKKGYTLNVEEDYLFSLYKGIWRQIEKEKNNLTHISLRLFFRFEYFFSFDLDRVLISWDWNLNPLKGCLLY